MTERILSQQNLDAFRGALVTEEKSGATVEKYLRDARAFAAFAQGRAVTKALTIAFKKWLEEQSYAVRSINSILVSLNRMLKFLGWDDCKVKPLRCQRRTYTMDFSILVPWNRCLPFSPAKSCSTGLRIGEESSVH